MFLLKIIFLAIFRKYKAKSINYVAHQNGYILTLIYKIIM